MVMRLRTGTGCPEPLHRIASFSFFHHIWKCKRREITLHCWSWCSFSFLYGPVWSKGPFMMHGIPSRHWGSKTERYSCSFGADTYRHFCKGHCSCLAKSRCAASLSYRSISKLAPARVLQCRQETEVQWNFDASPAHYNGNKIRCGTKLFIYTVSERLFLVFLRVFHSSLITFSFPLLSLKVVLGWLFPSTSVDGIDSSLILM